MPLPFPNAEIKKILVSFKESQGHYPSMVEWSVLRKENPSYPNPNSLTRRLGVTKWAQVLSFFGLEEKESSQVLRLAEAKVESTFQFLSKFNRSRGYLPSATEYKFLQESDPSLMHPYSLQRRAGASSYAEALIWLGVASNESESLSYKATVRKMESFGVQFSREIPVEIEGNRYCIDFEVRLPNKTVYVEIDGASHYSIEYWKSMPWCSDPEGALAKKKERDRILDSHVKVIGAILLRIEHYEFLKIDTFTFISLLNSCEAGLIGSIYKPELVAKVRDLIQQGYGYGQMQLHFGVDGRALRKMKSLGLIPSAHKRTKQPISTLIANQKAPA